MAALTRIALLALGVIAYRNRDKLADMVSGLGRRQEGSTGRKPAGALTDDSSARNGSGETRPSLKAKRPRLVDTALEASTSLSGQSDGLAPDAPHPAPHAPFASDTFPRDISAIEDRPEETKPARAF